MPVFTITQPLVKCTPLNYVGYPACVVLHLSILYCCSKYSMCVLWSQIQFTAVLESNGINQDFFLFPKRKFCTSLKFAALWPIWALADHNGGCRMILPDDMLATAQCAIRKPFVVYVWTLYSLPRFFLLAAMDNHCISSDLKECALRVVHWRSFR